MANPAITNVLHFAQTQGFNITPETATFLQLILANAQPPTPTLPNTPLPEVQAGPTPTTPSTVSTHTTASPQIPTTAHTAPHTPLPAFTPQMTPPFQQTTPSSPTTSASGFTPFPATPIAFPNTYPRVAAAPSPPTQGTIPAQPPFKPRAPATYLQATLTPTPVQLQLPPQEQACLKPSQDIPTPLHPNARFEEKYKGPSHHIVRLTIRYKIQHGQDTRQLDDTMKDIIHTAGNHHAGNAHCPFQIHSIVFKNMDKTYSRFALTLVPANTDDQFDEGLYFDFIEDFVRLNLHLNTRDQFHLVHGHLYAAAANLPPNPPSNPAISKHMTIIKPHCNSHTEKPFGILVGPCASIGNNMNGHFDLSPQSMERIRQTIYQTFSKNHHPQSEFARTMNTYNKFCDHIGVYPSPFTQGRDRTMEIFISASTQGHFNALKQAFSRLQPDEYCTLGGLPLFIRTMPSSPQSRQVLINEHRTAATGFSDSSQYTTFTTKSLSLHSKADEQLLLTHFAPHLTFFIYRHRRDDPLDGHTYHSITLYFRAHFTNQSFNEAQLRDQVPPQLLSTLPPPATSTASATTTQRQVTLAAVTEFLENTTTMPTQVTRVAIPQSQPTDSSPSAAKRRCTTTDQAMDQCQPLPAEFAHLSWSWLYSIPNPDFAHQFYPNTITQHNILGFESAREVVLQHYPSEYPAFINILMDVASTTGNPHDVNARFQEHITKTSPQTQLGA